MLAPRPGKAQYFRWRDGQEFTAQPLVVPTVNGADSSGDWFRLPKPKQKFGGLSRTTWNELTDSGQVKYITLRKKHAQCGIKLIFRPSPEAFLKRLMVDGSNDGQGEELK